MKALTADSSRTWPDRQPRFPDSPPALLQPAASEHSYTLVGNHMFFGVNLGLPPVRRLAAQVGWDNFGLLIELIKADRLVIWADPQQAGIGDLEAAYRQVVAEGLPLTAAELALSSEGHGRTGVEPALWGRCGNNCWKLSGTIPL